MTQGFAKDVNINTEITAPLSAFNEVLTVARQNIIELKSNVNVVSALRDVTTLTGSATVTSHLNVREEW